MSTDVAETVGFAAIEGRHLRRMGANRLSGLRAARDLKRRGIINSDMSGKEIATAIAVEIAANNAEEVEVCRAEDGRDWESFFAALVKFFEMIMPFILMFL